jgi:hypothetical protein
MEQGLLEAQLLGNVCPVVTAQVTEGVCQVMMEKAKTGMGRETWSRSGRKTMEEFTGPQALSAHKAGKGKF